MIKIQNLKKLKPYIKNFFANHTYFVAVCLKDNHQFLKFHDCHWVFFAGMSFFTE